MEVLGIECICRNCKSLQSLFLVEHGNISRLFVRKPRLVSVFVHGGIVSMQLLSKMVLVLKLRKSFFTVGFL